MMCNAIGYVSSPRERFAAKQRYRDAIIGKTAMDILDKLHAEHEKVKGLLSRMVDSEDAQERKELFEEFKDALVRHARAEEKAMYDPMIALDEEEPEEQGDEGYIEHELVDVMLKK